MVRGGNSGFLKNGTIYGSSNSCLRIILLRDQGIEYQPTTQADWERQQMTFNLGFANENFHKAYFEKMGWRYEADVGIQASVIKGVEYGGHADFIVRKPEKTVYELKSISSTSSYEKVIKKGQYKIENLAQTVNYMIAFEIPVGVLRYSSFIYHNGGKDKKIAPVSRDFNITLSEEGDIVIDGTPTVFNVSHVMEHRKEAARYLKKVEVYPDRPQAFYDGDFDPCGLCPFLNLCNSFDKKEIKTSKEYIDKARDFVHNATTPTTEEE